MKESNIISEIKKGNQMELEKVYLKHKDAFRSWIVSRFKITQDDATEIYHQSILSFYENIIGGKLIKLNCSIKTYLFPVGKNKVFDLRRKQNRLMGLDENTLPKDTARSGSDDPTDQLLIISKQALLLLGNPCKTLLELYYYHKQSMQQIAGQMGYKNENSTKNQKYKCLNKLREIFRTEVQKEKIVIHEV